MDPFFKQIIESVPQIQRPRKEDHISGISTMLARCLLQVDMCHLARAYEVLADFGLLGTVMTRKDFINTLAEYLGNEGSRTAFDLLSGKTANRNATKGKYKKEEAYYKKKLSEFLVRIVYSGNMGVIQGTNLTKNPKGGRPTKEAYIPTEGEMVQILVAIMIPGISDDLDWISSVPKPMMILTNQSLYKAFIMSIKVFDEGKGDYARSTLANLVGIHKNSARKYAEKMGITVTTNEPKLKPISEKRIAFLPKDEKERDRRIEIGDIPEGIHIQNTLKKKFAYTQAGALAAIADSKDKGGSGEIFEARYVASTYDPETSAYYSGSKKEEEPILVSDERYELSKFVSITSYNYAIPSSV